VTYGKPKRVVVERQGPRPKQGVSAVFKAGRGVGVIEGVVAALGWPLEWVSPAAWKATMKVPKPKGPQKQRVAERKELSRRRASELMPDMAHRWARVKDHGRAEAVLMCLSAS